MFWRWICIRRRQPDEKTVKVRAIYLGLSAMLLASSVSGAEPLVARVSPKAVGTAPRDVFVRAYIEPDIRNRSLEFVVDSGNFYASSTVQLDRDRAPRLKEVRFRELPAGRYEIRVTLAGADGERAVVVNHIQLW